MKALTPEREAHIREAVAMALKYPPIIPVHDVSGDTFHDPTTNFSPSAFLDAEEKLGSECQGLVVYPMVFGGMRIKHLVDLVPGEIDENRQWTFMGRPVLVWRQVGEDARGLYDSWLFDDSEGPVKFVRLVTREFEEKKVLPWTLSRLWERMMAWLH